MDDDWELVSARITSSLSPGEFDRGAKDVKAVVGVAGSTIFVVVPKSRGGVEYCR